jgi:hypothetical protein
MDHEAVQTPVFSIWRRGRLLAQFSLNNGDHSLPETLSEADAITLELDKPEPGSNYRVLVGDFPHLPGHTGRKGVEWSEATYLDSARGSTTITLQSSESEHAQWRTRGRVSLYVLPSKATEAGYQAMLDSLSELASGLIFDIAAKSRAGLALLPRGAKRARDSLSAHVELQILESAWRSMSSSVHEILRAPEKRLILKLSQRKWAGAEPLDAASLLALSSRGLDPRKATPGTTMVLRLPTRIESFRTREHEFVGTMLALARARAGECARRAVAEIGEIEKDRAFRERNGEDGPSLYQTVDVPRLEVLSEAVRKAASIELQIRQVQPYFSGGTRDNVLSLAQFSPVFDNVPAYNRFRRTALGWLGKSWAAVDFGAHERLKPTWRMYEQWVFLSVAEAFRVAGMRCISQRDFAQVLTSGRYSVDLQRGATLLFEDARGRRLRITYEPWILPLDLAQARGDSVFQGVSGAAAWSPDILIESIPQNQVNSGPDYALVIDAKYSRTPDIYSDKLQKYHRIRSVGTGRQIVKQVWAASPSGLGVRIDDETVEWTYAGPSIARDEQLLGHLTARPGDPESSGLAAWAEGTLAFLGYEAGPVSPLPVPRLS